MIHQASFSQAEFATKKKTTRREKFLARMEEVIPWAQLLAVIEPHYPKGERGRPPVGLERMLRVYFLQQWHGLADEALADALYDSQALRGFARIDLSTDDVPDATTLLKFRRLLETPGLCKGLFTAINAGLTERGLLLREGTLADATLKRGVIKALVEGVEKEAVKAVEKAKASVRAFLEHPFHIVKNLF
ncbi:MAG: transposase, partial [Verrucomicrobiales bacterium]|nr:transposase [Verrucomicrobiales bacterium]